MKYIECNQNQKVMWRVVVENANDIIGGNINTLLDYPKDSKEYQDSLKDLNDLEGIIDFVRTETFNSPEWKRMTNTHFITKEWLEERCRRITTKLWKDSKERGEF